jgi:hypothetical protein
MGAGRWTFVAGRWGLGARFPAPLGQGRAPHLPSARSQLAAGRPGARSAYAAFPPASACAANLALASSIFRP